MITINRQIDNRLALLWQIVDFWDSQGGILVIPREPALQGLAMDLLAAADRMVGGDDAWLIIDDTALPKKGRHSVGVAPQYAFGAWEERQLSNPGIVDLGVGRGAGHGWLTAVSARELDERYRPARTCRRAR